MLDPETPPVVEGNADGGVADGRRIAQAIPAVATASKLAASTALPWITAIAARSAETKASVDAAVPALLRPMLLWNPNHFRPTAMPIRASLPSSMICFSRPRFRRRPA